MTQSSTEGPSRPSGSAGVRKRLVLFSVLVALAVVALVRLSGRDPKAHDEASHADTYSPSAPDLDQSIPQAADLRAAGITAGSVRRIEQQLASLNTALARLSAVHRDYHAAGSDAEREAIQARARPLHHAVDRAEDADPR